jgi:hypothetical protein
LVAVTTTLLPVARLVSASFRASAESTLLSAGTGSAIAVATDVPAVAGALHATVKVVVDALAGTAKSAVAASATAEAIAISGFLIEVIYLLIID